MPKPATNATARRGPKAYPVRTPEEIGTGLATIKETAAYLCMSPERLYLLAGRGVIPSYRIGNSRRFKLAEVDTWVAAQQQAA